MNHLTGKTRISPNNNFSLFSLPVFFDKCGICSREFNNIKRCQIITGFSSNRSANSGNGFNQCHVYFIDFNLQDNQYLLYDTVNSRKKQSENWIYHKLNRN